MPHPAPPSGRAYLTRFQAAMFAQVSESTIDRWRKQGLRWSQPVTNGTVYIRTADLLDWLEHRRITYPGGG